MTDKKRGSGEIIRVNTPDLSALSLDTLTQNTLRQYISSAFAEHPDNRDARAKYYLDLVEHGLPELQQEVAAARAALNDETQGNILAEYQTLRTNFRLLAFFVIMGKPEQQ
ncbi:hypothetical protein KA517_05060 [Candidatus Gracilibacteria bacterium]|nr:hypothetical protein [Candidatus Gracilibacteria bacterium]